jgi:hypothetical protein
VKKFSFGLLELEMADLECFWRKTPLGPLGIKKQKSKILRVKQTFSLALYSSILEQFQPHRCI